MPSEAPQPYESPAIQGRTAIGPPLVATAVAPSFPVASAAFRPSPRETPKQYEQPKVADRTPLADPLVGGTVASAIDV
jgi:hypothetical protein